MANEDPDSIPQQVRNNRPIFIAFLVAVLIAVGTFLWVVSTPKPNELQRNIISDPNSATGKATPNTGYLGTETPPASPSQ